jgi:ribonuclease HI
MTVRVVQALPSEIALGRSDCRLCCSQADAEEVEAKAALEGIKLLSNLGHTKVILELDCVVVAKALCSQEPDRSKAWNTYEEAKVLMKAFQDHTISLVRRGSNCVADALAKLARRDRVSILGINLTLT